MRPAEPRAFEHEDALDPCNDEQVQAWASRYDVAPEVIRDTCQQVGGNRVAMELKLAAPQP